MSIRNESYCLIDGMVSNATFRSCSLLVLAAASVLAAGGWAGAKLHAATQTWAPGNTEGSGNWDTSIANWNPGPTTWSNNNVAIFGLGGSGTTAYTVTIDTTGITASALTFNTGAAYTIAGTSTDNLTLSNGGSSGTVDFIMNANASISTPFTVDSNLLITGSKTLTFAPASSITFSNSPTLTIGDGGVSGIPALAALASGGGGSGSASLILDGGTFLSYKVGQLTSLGGTGVINTFDANNNLTSSVQNSITQNVAGTTFVLQDGTINLVADNSTFTAGNLQIGSSTSANPTDVVIGYQVSSANNNNLPASGVTINLDGGTLTQASANVTINSNTYTVDTAPNTVSNAITLTGANTISPGTLFNLTLAGNITGSGSLIVNGAGVSTRNVILTGTDTYSGGTTISTGQLLQIGSGGTTGSIIGNVINNGGYLAFARSDSITFGGVISGTNGVLSQFGIGTLTLTGANTYTGYTNDYGNTIAIGAGGSISNSAQVLLEGKSSVFDISAGGNQTIQKLTGFTGTSVNLGGNTLTEGAGGSSTFSGSITGTGGGIVKTGTGTLTLLGPATYTGPTSIQGGSLTIGVGGSINGTSALIIATGAKLNLASTAAGDGVLINYGSGASPNSTIQNDLANGAMTAPSGYAVGYADGADGVVSGLSAGQEKLMVTLLGDATLSGRVGLAAYGIVLANFGMQSGAQWDQGDFTYNGKVNLADYGYVLANFGQSLSAGSLAASGPLDRVRLATGPLGQGAPLATPEPATLALLTLGILGLLPRRSGSRTK